jgi:hypothetical protein
MPISRAPRRLTAVARSALPCSVRSKNSHSNTISATDARKMISVCPLSVSGPMLKRSSQKLGLRKPSAPKKNRPRPGQREVHAHRHDQQHQHAGIGQRLVGQAVDQRAEGRDQGQRQQRLHQQRQLGSGAAQMASSEMATG